MKRKFFVLPLVAIMAAACIAGLAGCGSNGVKFEANGIDKVIEAVKAHNYSVRDDSDTEAVIHVTDQVIARDKKTISRYYGTVLLRYSEEGYSYVGVYSYYRETGMAGGSPMSSESKVNTLDEVYEKQGYTAVILRDWQYDEATKSYTCGNDTLRINGASVVVECESEISESGKQTVEFFDFGVTTCEIPGTVRNFMVKNDGYKETK